MIDVKVNEVGTRDGLQSVTQFVPTAIKKKWCEDESRAGIREMPVDSIPNRLASGTVRSQVRIALRSLTMRCALNEPAAQATMM